jgi:uncharacterized protein YfdQ (DUF2303 family)
MGVGGGSVSANAKTGTAKKDTTAAADAIFALNVLNIQITSLQDALASSKRENRRSVKARTDIKTPERKPTIATE